MTIGRNDVDRLTASRRTSADGPNVDLKFVAAAANRAERSHYLDPVALGHHARTQPSQHNQRNRSNQQSAGESHEKGS